MTDVIQLLPDHVANQIAAGEVVQRPASVVKELLENAIDAKATFIKLIVVDAGKTLIQVVDNGLGMSNTDARLSFERHATSKIAKAEDLFQLVTKGFRGEALASIAAIAHVNLKTKREKDEVGTEITIEGSAVKSQNVIVTPTGTSVAVKHLFYNVPARRKFLKSNAVETRHIMDEFHRVALAHSEIQFSMFNNDSEIFHLSKTNFRQRIVSIFGSKINERIVPVNETTEVVTISGFVGKPEYSKKSKGEQFFFVNNRFIKSGYLNHSIVNAFEGILPQGHRPSYFINLEVKPDTIDINIHPTKTEIKFDDEHTLFAILRAAVKHSLGQFQITPALDFERDSNLDIPYNYTNKSSNYPAIEVDRNFNPFSKTDKANSQVYKHANLKSWEALYTGLTDVEANNQHSKIEFESVGNGAKLFDELELNQHSLTHQIHNKYIVSPIKSGVLFIDQNRAHQRVLYERFLQHLTTNKGMSQQLLFPVVVNLTPAESSIILNIQFDLEDAGFVFGDTTMEAIAFNGIPVNIAESDISYILEQLIFEIQNNVPNVHFSATDMLAKAMAKQMAIKTGQSLAIQEQEELVNQLFACKAPNESPNHKKTFITLSLSAIENQF